MRTARGILYVVSAGLLLAGCRSTSASLRRAAESADNELVGAWRARVQFKTGPWATFKDLEFTYVFNAGGTLTGSSNYAGAPPAPPAYGEWRALGRHQFEARYSFVLTKPPPRLDEIPVGGGWLPIGRGVVEEQITVADDGRSYFSHLKCTAFDAAGHPTDGGGEAQATGVRLGF